MTPHSCLHCGKSIDHMRASANYCSRRCRYEGTKPHCLAQAATWRAANPDRIRATGRAYRERIGPNPARRRQAEWRERNRERFNAYHRDYYRDHLSKAART